MVEALNVYALNWNCILKNYNFRENFKDIVKNQTFLNEKSK